VHVYVEEVQAGVVVTIEDGGLVMGPAALRRAERAVSAEALDLTTLSGTRLGLAVVGVLARKHGLTVSFRPSSRGGTGVIVIIPRQLITQARLEGSGLPGAPTVAAGGGLAGQGLGRGGERSARYGDADELMGARVGSGARYQPVDNLPKRDRGHTLASSTRSVAAMSADDGESTQDRPPASPSAAGARFGAFQQASRARMAGPAASPPTGDEEDSR
jgi:hypothetical protein